MKGAIQFTCFATAKRGSNRIIFVATRCFGVNTAKDPKWIASLKAIPIGKTCTLSGDVAQKRKIMPLVVAFHDETIPKTIYEITAENSATTYGESIRIHRIRIGTRRPLHTIDTHHRQTLALVERHPVSQVQEPASLDPFAPAGSRSEAPLLKPHSLKKSPNVTS